MGSDDLQPIKARAARAHERMRQINDRMYRVYGVLLVAFAIAGALLHASVAVMVLLQVGAVALAFAIARWRR